MKVYAINGSPRKAHNTATLLEKALAGAREAAGGEEIQTEMIHLYDLQYTGCISCFACKRLGGSSYGQCAVQDDLRAVLEKVSQADGLIFGSPIYFGNLTAQLMAFFERLLFSYLVYDKTYSTIAPKKMPTAFIYTMNVREEAMEQAGYLRTFEQIAARIGRVLTKPEYMCANNTYQFDDYGKYKSDAFSADEKAAHRDKQFPLDCDKAFALGANLIKPVLEE
jgi:multimeric flavodoxin WrbA